MRTISKWLVAIAATIVVSGHQNANAGFVGMPHVLGSMMKRISFSNFTLPPMAFTQFCLRYANQCKPQRMVFRARPDPTHGGALGRPEGRQRYRECGHRTGAQHGRSGRGKVADSSRQRRLQRLCGDQTFRIAGARLAHSRTPPERSRHLLGRTPPGAGGANLNGRSRARQHDAANSAVGTGAVSVGANSDRPKIRTIGLRSVVAASDGNRRSAT